MVTKNTCPPTRRKFANKWDEMGYLCDKITYYIHTVNIRFRAKPFLHRLKRICQLGCLGNDAIVTETAYALCFEYEKNWKFAVQHRKREIDLILQLYNSFTDNQNIEVREFALQGRKKQNVIAQLLRIKQTYLHNQANSEAECIDELIESISISAPRFTVSRDD